MDVLEAVAKRHSYRGPFRDESVSRDDLVSIAKSAIQAPSGKNAQTTRFAVVDDPELVREIGAMHPGNQAMKTAKAFVVALNDLKPEAIDEGHNFQIEDCAAAVENMLLAVTALGYATVWVDGWLRVQGRAQRVAEIIGAPDGILPRVVLPIGVPEEDWQPKAKMPFEDRVWFNRF